jgi:Ca-activated chloride channel family protein
MMPMTSHLTPDLSAGGRLVAVDPRTLPLTHASLTADAGGGLARVVLEQRFRNPHAEPLAVTYSLPLPHDAAVSGFAFTIGDRRIVGEVDGRRAARERFEQALVDGRTAALLEQDRSTVFTQQLGNVPPGQEVVAEITIDQKLAWTDEGAWQWRFPTTVAPRYLGAPGRVPDAERIFQDVADQPMPVRMTFAVTLRDDLQGRLPQSPSHALRAFARSPESGAEHRRSGSTYEQAEVEGVPLDRDVVVRWSVARPEPGLRVETARGPGDETFALLTLVPPTRTAARERVSRDLVLLLDISGSMAGEPIAQAKRVTSALVSTLGERDSLEMIAFSSSPRRWKRGATRATPDARREALAWIAALSAGGGTEMRHAIEEALEPLRADAQRQVVVVTDGAIGFESEVVATILRRLPAPSRVHVVGVGSAPNRTLTAGAPRAGRGIEVLVGLGEDAERAAARIVARTDAPVVVDLSITGEVLRDHAPVRLPDLFAGAPALVALRTAGQGEGELVVRGRTEAGPWEQRVRVDAPREHARRAVATLYARERVEDLEMEIAAGGDVAALEARIERLGLDFGIATRVTSWIAATEERTVDPKAPVRRVRVPHELPHGTSVEGFGLRQPGGMPVLPAAAGSVLTETATMQAMVTRAGGIAPGASAKAPLAPRAMAPSRAAPPPPPAQQPPGAPAGGVPFVRKAREALGALFGGRAGARERRLGGRVVARDAQGLVVELDFPEALAWALPAEVEITWDDGTTSPAMVLADRSSAPGAVQAGASVRLAIDAPDARAPRVVSFDLGGESWVVMI